MIQIALVVCMGALQVFIVRFFFQVCRTIENTNTDVRLTGGMKGARKGYV
jgi:hypothetical protein